MSDSNLPSPAPANSSELAELKELCADLQWQTQTLRIALLIVAGALCGYFWLEVKRNGQALAMLRPQAAQVLEASKVQDPIANRFVGQLVEFSKTHPDFAAILKKYPIQAGAPATSPATAPATAPAPATTAPAVPKK